MDSKRKFPNPRKHGQIVDIDWIMSNCKVEFMAIPMSECWIWMGTQDQDGYGMVRSSASQGPMRRTHRVAYHLVYGDIPIGMQLDHVCRIRKCCNPLHMDVVTLHENVLRGERHKPWLAECVKCGSDDIAYRKRGNGRNRECRACKRVRDTARRKAALTDTPSLCKVLPGRVRKLLLVDDEPTTLEGVR